MGQWAGRGTKNSKPYTNSLEMTDGVCAMENGGQAAEIVTLLCSKVVPSS